LPVEFEITCGEVNDCSAAPDLIARLPDTKAIIADKGYDSEWIREQITKKGARAVIPRKRNSLKGNADMDWSLYSARPRTLKPSKEQKVAPNFKNEDF
jgi:hypothetical protein